MNISRKYFGIHLYNLFCNENKLKKKHADIIIDNILEGIKKQINIYGKFVIPNFGSFILKERKEKVGRDFVKNKNIAINKKNKISFYSSNNLKDRLNSSDYKLKIHNYSTKLSRYLKINLDFLSLEEAKNITNTFFEYLISNIIKNNKIVFNKYFSISLRIYKNVKGINPFTGKEYFIQERRKPLFKFYDNMYLKDR